MHSFSPNQPSTLGAPLLYVIGTLMLLIGMWGTQELPAFWRMAGIFTQDHWPTVLCLTNMCIKNPPSCTVTLGSNLAIPSEVEGVHTLWMILQFYFYVSTLEKCPHVHNDVHCNTVFNREKLKMILLPIGREWISSEWISGGWWTL